MSTIAENAAQTGRTMKAYRVHAFGPPEVTIAEDVEIPAPGKDEVLIKVHAAGVWPLGWLHPFGKQCLALAAAVDARFRSLGHGRSGRRRCYACDPRRCRFYGVTNPRFIGAYAEYVIAAAGKDCPGSPQALAISTPPRSPSSRRPQSRRCSITRSSPPGRRC